VTGGAGALIWDTATGKVVRALEGHIGPVTSVAYSTDGKLVVTGGEDRTVRLWDSGTGRQVAVLRGYRSPVTRVELDRTGRYLLTEVDYGSPRVSDCTACLHPYELRAVARAQRTRELTRDERRDAGLDRP
jgi:WD40 repeat protein